jgi:four helix bundle protein
MQDFRQLRVWQKGHQMTLDVYRATKGFPSDERYGLTSQMRRASASIPANIAEGCGRGGSAELGRFAEIALGSASELDYHLLLARDLGLISPGDHQRLEGDVAELKKMLVVFVQKLRTNN